MALNWLNLIAFELFVSFFSKAILFPYETLDLFFLNIFIKKRDLCFTMQQCHNLLLICRSICIYKTGCDYNTFTAGLEYMILTFFFNTCKGLILNTCFRIKDFHTFFTVTPQSFISTLLPFCSPLPPTWQLHL